MIRRLRRRVGSALDRRFRGVNERVESVGRRVERLEQLSEALGSELHELRETVGSELHELRETNAAALQLLLQDHAGNRARLRAQRREPGYEEAFEDPEPLVSVVIPTYDNTAPLLEGSLPSVLGQTYERLEVIVVGDAAPVGVGEAVAAVGDSRVRFVNLPYRLPEPVPYRHWLIGSVAARNAGHELARGAWVVDFDDDDALRPRAVERGLELAREQRLEVAYGGCLQHLPDGSVDTLATFPPEHGKFVTQGALVHGGLRFFERSPAAAVFVLPNDWFRIEAMLRAGVRFGMYDEIAVDYFPSMRGARR